MQHFIETINFEDEIILVIMYDENRLKCRSFFTLINRIKAKDQRREGTVILGIVLQKVVVETIRQGLYDQALTKNAAENMLKNLEISQK